MILAWASPFNPNYYFIQLFALRELNRIRGNWVPDISSKFILKQ